MGSLAKLNAILGKARDYGELAELLLKDEFKLWRFQLGILKSMSKVDKLLTQAPSQSGKSTLLGLFAIMRAILMPNSLHILMSATADTAKELMFRMQKEILPSLHFVQEHRDKSAYRLTFLGYDIRITHTDILFMHNNSRIRIVPKSIKQLTGKPADTVILDEMAKWEQDAHLLFAESEARLGSTEGKLLGVSTFYGAGEFSAVGDKPFVGNYYHYKHLASYHDVRRPEDKTKKAITALSFSYKASPKLKRQMKDIIQENRNEPFWVREHYYGLARKTVGLPIFQDYFDIKEHVTHDPKSLWHNGSPLIVGFDPGGAGRSACVIAQHNQLNNNILVLKATLANSNENFPEFVSRMYTHINTTYRDAHIQLVADVATNQGNNGVPKQNLNIIRQIFNGRSVFTCKQSISDGIQLMQLLFKQKNRVKISSTEDYIIQALATGLVAEESESRKDTQVYKKEGFYEHGADCLRYVIWYVYRNTDVREVTGMLPSRINRGFRYA